MRISANSGVPFQHTLVHRFVRRLCVCVAASTKIEQIDGVFSKTRIMSLLLAHRFIRSFTLLLVLSLSAVSLLADTCACFFRTRRSSDLPPRGDKYCESYGFEPFAGGRFSGHYPYRREKCRCRGRVKHFKSAFGALRQ